MIYLILGIIGMTAAGYLLNTAGAVPIGGIIGLLAAAALKQKAALSALQNRLASSAMAAFHAGALVDGLESVGHMAQRRCPPPCPICPRTASAAHGALTSERPSLV